MRRSQEIVEYLAQRMADGELAPGDRLPSERGLAASFGVSRGVVREALRHLAAQGVVESRLGDGAYVREAPHAGLGRALARGMGSERQRLAHLFAFRRVLETGMAELAARHATARDLEALKSLAADQHRRLLDAPQAGGVGDGDLDAAFHLALAKATGNPVFAQAMRALTPLLAETRSAELLSPARRAASAQHHLRILDAVARRDPERARQAMERHLLDAEAAAASEPASLEPPTF
jgi:GntR family transcriptional repressor for pyruvate dehydrogenase complex